MVKVWRFVAVPVRDVAVRRVAVRCLMKFVAV